MFCPKETRQKNSIGGNGVTADSFLQCKFRSFLPLFSSVIRSPPPIFFGDFLLCHISFKIDVCSLALGFLRRLGHRRQFFSVQISLFFASVFFGDSVTTASFLQSFFWRPTSNPGPGPGSLALLFSSVIRSPPSVFFGANFAFFRLCFLR